MEAERQGPELYFAKARLRAYWFAVAGRLSRSMALMRGLSSVDMDRQRLASYGLLHLCDVHAARRGSGSMR